LAEQKFGVPFLQFGFSCCRCSFWLFVSVLVVIPTEGRQLARRGICFKRRKRCQRFAFVFDFVFEFSFSSCLSSGRHPEERSDEGSLSDGSNNAIAERAANRAARSEKRRGAA
jgi:hypothetical protein